MKNNFGTVLQTKRGPGLDLVGMSRKMKVRPTARVNQEGEK